MKKVSLYTLLVSVILFGAFILLSAFQRSPEEFFIGQWQESVWDYREADRCLLKPWGTASEKQGHRQPYQRMHVGESWIFRKNGELLLVKADSTQQLQWCLKGRGNVLEISDGYLTEHYDITALSHDKIELNYISDMQIKETARLVFTKKKGN